MARYQLRLGMVLYGGASLAIYMNGMVQEVLAVLRAAHARKLAGTAAETDWVRHQLAQNPYCAVLETAEADVVVDVISGTSAGGLNGLMLAKALACGAPDLSGLTRLWQEAAQISRLAMYDADPRSVLSGDFLYEEMRKVMSDLSAQADPTLAALVPVLDLFVTATDVRGHRWTRRDRYDQRVAGLAHRYLFHLRKRMPQSGGRGYHQNDFWTGESLDQAEIQARRDALMAKIGRATSAFPAVFPPVNITRAEALAAGLPILADIDPAYQNGLWFSDGGILANKPFEPVLDTIMNRSADLPVRRVLTFLEPDPEIFVARDQTEPSMVETGMAAVTLPMSQDILEHLDRLRQENERRGQLLEFLMGLDRAVERMDTEEQERISRRLEQRLKEAALAAKASPKPSDTAAEAAAAEAAAAHAAAAEAAAAEAAAAEAHWDSPSFSPLVQGYYVLRLNRLRHLLAGTLERALEGMGIAPPDLAQSAAQGLLDRIAPLRDPEPSPDALQSFLRLYDAEFHSRRIHFLLARLSAHYKPGVTPSDPSAMRAAMSGLWGALEDWNNARWMIANAGALSAQPEPWSSHADRLNRTFQLWAEAVRAEGGAPGAALEQATDRAIAALGDFLGAVRERAAAEEEAALRALQRALPLRSAATGEPLEPTPDHPVLRAASLWRISRDFEPIDVLLFPIQTYANGGDWDRIGLYRLSPNAADGWVKKATKEKLAGESVGHFGAFLDERWRSNDIMWGRLDGAELLIRMIVQESELVEQAPGTRLSESQYPQAIQDALEARRRQILADFPELIDLRAVQGMTRKTKVSPSLPRLSWSARFARAYDVISSGQVAAAAMPAEQAPPFDLAQAPYYVIRKYLKEQYRVGAEGLDSLPSRQLAGEILLLLHNTVHALRKPAPSSLLKLLQKVLVFGLTPLNWLARLVLIPRTGLFGQIQGNLGPLLTLVGVVLLTLQLTGAIRLQTGGWAILATLLAPVILDSLFRPSLLRVATTFLIAAVTGSAALLTMTGLEASLPIQWDWLSSWLPRLGSAWIFGLALFGTVTLAYSRRRSDRTLKA